MIKLGQRVESYCHSIFPADQEPTSCIQDTAPLISSCRPSVDENPSGMSWQFCSFGPTGDGSCEQQEKD